jgi:TPR repeat protein
LGNIYRIGEGVPQNDTAAVKWYTLAADQNYALAQYALGVMYSKGNAALRDYKRAYMWYDIAASNGVVKGVQHKIDIAKEMTPPQIEEAKKMSLRYFKNIYADV